MKRGKPLKRTGFLRRTGRLASMSMDRKRMNAQRRKMLEQYKSDLCAAASLLPDVHCGGSLDPHEPLTRARGGSITDPDNLTWICRNHHDFIHGHPTEGYEVGLLCHSWDAP